MSQFKLLIFNLYSVENDEKMFCWWLNLIWGKLVTLPIPLLPPRYWMLSWLRGRIQKTKAARAMCHNFWWYLPGIECFALHCRAMFCIRNDIASWKGISAKKITFTFHPLPIIQIMQHWFVLSWEQAFREKPQILQDDVWSKSWNNIYVLRKP